MNHLASPGPGNSSCWVVNRALRLGQAVIYCSENQVHCRYQVCHQSWLSNSPAAQGGGPWIFAPMYQNLASCPWAGRGMNPAAAANLVTSTVSTLCVTNHGMISFIINPSAAADLVTRTVSRLCVTNHGNISFITVSPKRKYTLLSSRVLKTEGAR